MRARLIAAVAALLLMLVSAPQAQAHDALTGSSPADGATVATAPSKVVLSFSGVPVVEGAQVRVTGPGGEAQVGAPTAMDRTLSQQLRDGLAAGTYTVQWRVTSNDGHPISGRFTFTTTAAGAGPTATTASSSVRAAPTSGQPAPTANQDQGMSAGSLALVGVGAALLLGLVVFAVRRTRVSSDQ